MHRTVHRVAIDVYSIPYRGCRSYQERIAEYSMQGRPLFEWDKMRERYFTRRLRDIVDICEPCPLNIFGTIEGCMGDVEGFNAFLKVLMLIRPESSLFKHRYQDEHLSHDQTRALLSEFEAVQELMGSTEWPVAQIYLDGEPKTVNTPRQYAFVEWEGDDTETFVFSNEGYTVGVSKDGIVVKDAGGNTSPHVYTALRRVRTAVTGETAEGKAFPFDPVRERTPAWDDEPGYVDSELVFHKLPAVEIFNDVLEVFTTCAAIALKHNAGLSIKSVA
ncbi:MAG: hypothetical protein ACYCW6_04995 [Candidatus Xenobia bacterium]